ncbi:MAG: hypothetical protein NVSMB65_04240 [Chloroflexota bacterium]
MYPPAGAIDIPALVAAGAPAGRTWYLLQMDRPLTGAIDARVAAAGGLLSGYVPFNTLLVGVTRHDLARVARLPFVRWMGLLLPRYRVDPALWDRAPGAQAHAGTIELLVHGFVHAGLSDRSLQAAGAVVLGRSSHPLLGTRLRVRIPWQGLATLAAVRTVAWIEPLARFRSQSDVVRRITNINRVWTATGLYGAGQTVAIADTGLDTGVTTTLSADFAGRIAAVQALGRPGQWDDPNGHGTHVAGILAGSGVASGSDPATHRYVGSLAGMAPEARLVIQSVLDKSGDIGGIPDDISGLFQKAYDAGARIHNDSWDNVPTDGTGRLAFGAYDSAAQETDAFVWTHPDMLIVLAAGNDGTDVNPADGIVDSGSMESPALAKNVIAVGASESDRPPHTGQGGLADLTWGNTSLWGPNNARVRFTKEPIASSYLSANPDGMAPISSRGPTADGRIKPDISAPGINIATTRSAGEPADGSWGPVPLHPHYVYDGGTSMAAPVVAGAAALLREYLAPAHPSAALLKALLLNSAHDMSPGQYGTGAQREMTVRPNNVEGWGRLDLGAVIAPPGPSRVGWLDATTGISTGQVLLYAVAVTDTTVPLHVTLAWSDYPGTLNAAGELVNDLDLTVRDPAGHLLYGNGVAGGDRRNTVETVDIMLPLAGTYTVSVTGHNIPQGPQPYALALSCGCDGSLQAAGSVLLPTPTAVPPPSVTPTAAAPRVAVPNHLTLAHRILLRRARVSRSLTTIVRAQQAVNHAHRVARIIIEGQALTPIVVLIDLSTGAQLRVRQTLDRRGHLDVSIALPAMLASTQPDIRRLRVVVGSGKAARTYSPRVR